jgi:hypothetical protein
VRFKAGRLSDQGNCRWLSLSKPQEIRFPSEAFTVFGIHLYIVIVTLNLNKKGGKYDGEFKEYFQFGGRLRLKTGKSLVYLGLWR